MVHQNDQFLAATLKNYERWGVAPSLTLGLWRTTQFTVLYMHQEDDNTPQYGVPYALERVQQRRVRGSRCQRLFRLPERRQAGNHDRLAHGIIEHSFSDRLSVRNLTRWQRVTQLAIVDAPQGTFCLASGINPYTGAACTARGTLTVTATGPRGNVRDTINEIMINQTDVRAQFQTGALAHTLVVGGSFSNETYHLDTGNILRTAAGATPTLPVISLSNPDTIYAGPLNFIRASFTDSQVKNRALYAFDRIEIGEHWELNGGVRVERNEGHATTGTVALPPASTITVAAPSDNADDLTSYRAGVVYKPTQSSSIYFAYGNSLTPSQSTVNGACTAVSTTGTANCNVDPEEARSYEVGAKWNAFDDRVLLTAALFRNERTNFRVASGDPTIPQQQLDGSSRVDGVALGAVGAITDAFYVYANYTYLDSKILQNISAIAIAGGALDFQKGDPLPNTPQHSFSLWTTYQPVAKVMLGYGATYSGEVTFNRFNATSPLFYAPDYWTHRAMASYELTDHATIQLNVNNIFDEKYYTRVRNNATSGWATPGDARNASVSVNYRF